MNKNHYQSAMKKIKASEDFQIKIKNSLQRPNNHKKNNRYIVIIPVLLFVCVAIYVGITQSKTLLDNQSSYDVVKEDSQSAKDKSTSKKEDTIQNDFKIIEDKEGVEASYIAVVYMDGYAYEPSEWLKYSLYLSDHTDYEALKGKKLGEVTLDLKGKKYTGTPPNFSSTYDAGTEIYEIRNIDPTSGILVKFQGNYDLFYRSRKLVSNIDEPLNLMLSDVFSMLSEKPEIVTVELRDEENGAWMNTSEDNDLMSLVNGELQGLSLKNYGEVDTDPYATSYRIPVNLIFKDGRALHMQILPQSQMAHIFGGFVPISKELSSKFQLFYNQGSSYPRLSDLIPYHETQITYLYLKNHKNGDEVICEEPVWSASGLYSILSYYRGEENEGIEGRMVLTAVLGESESNSITVNFFETADKKILTEIDGVYYKPVRGQLLFESLDNFLYNQTELGM